MGAVKDTLNVPDAVDDVPLVVLMVGDPSETDVPSILPVRLDGAPFAKLPLTMLVPPATVDEILEMTSEGCAVPIPRNADRAERVVLVSVTPSFNVTVMELLSDEVSGRLAADWPRLAARLAPETH